MQIKVDLKNCLRNLTDMKFITITLVIFLFFIESGWSQNYGLDYAPVTTYSQSKRVTVDGFPSSSYSGITYEAWCKLDAYYAGPNSMASGSFIFCRQYDESSYGNFGSVLVILSEDNQEGDNRKIGFGMNFGINHDVHVGLHSNSEVPLKEWHHIAATWDGDSMVVYLDGYWDGSHDVTILGPYYDPATTFFLGYREYYIRQMLDGMLDDARIWSYAKTQAQIQADMYKELTGNEAGLVAYWDFNSGSGQTVYDKTVNGYDGYLGTLSSSDTYEPTWVSSTAPLPYYSVMDGNWNTNATWATYQTAPDEPWAIVDIRNAVTATSSVVVDSLTIIPSASLTIGSGFNLTVSGTNGMLIQADATGMGSLISASTGVNATAQLYLTADSWHYLSPAVTGSQSGAFSGNYLRTFDENTYTWNPYITGLTTSLSPFTGYACWVPTTANTVELTGTLNTGTYYMTVTSNGNLDSPGWNLVGNPYASSLDWDAVSGWNKSNIDNTIYYYSGVDDAYHYYVGSGGSTPSVGVNDGTNEIPSMQGFFVKASATGTFSVNNDARIHSSQGFYKKQTSTNSAISLIRLQVNGNSDKDETVIRFVENATEYHDGMFDAWKLFSNAHPQIYSITTNGEDLAVNSLPEIQDSRIVQLGFYTPESNTFLLKVAELDAFPQDVKIYLEDLLTGEMIELNSDTQYSFSASTIDNSHRFNLHFQKPGAVDKNTKTSNVQIYSWGETIFVNDPENNSGNIVVFDLQGKMVKQIASENGQSKFTLNSDYNGYFLVRYVSDNKVSTAKVFIP